MHLVVGLGNPGKRYGHTRHNMGFLVADRFSEASTGQVEREKFHSLWREVETAGRRVVVVKPQTYMNLSGRSVQQWVSYYRLAAENVLVVHDDLDIELGRIKFTHGGGPGGHKGVESIIREVGTRDIPRLKVGIGRPRHGESVEAYVLDGFYPDETDAAGEVVKRAAAAVEVWVREGISRAMNVFH